MKHHVILLASTAALLTACGPTEPDPPPPIAPEDAGETAAPSASSSATDTMATADSSDSEVADPTSTDFDVETALSKQTAEGEWVTQPNWTGFGPPDSEAVFMARCGEFGMIQITRLLDAPPERPLRAALAAGNQVEEGYWTGDESDQMPSAHFEVYAEAPIFTAMMEADKIAVLAEGKDPLIVPGSDQLDEQIRACRNQGTAMP